MIETFNAWKYEHISIRIEDTVVYESIQTLIENFDKYIVC